MKLKWKSLSKGLFLMLALAGLTAVHSASPVVSKQPVPLRVDSMRFVYRTFEGDLAVVCKHQPLNSDSPYDWKIECDNGPTKFAEYTAHVALSSYDHASGPKFSVELLYWLTGTDLPSEVGSSTWFHFATKSDLVGISTSQEVAHGTAGLYLEIGSEAIRLSRGTR